MTAATRSDLTADLAASLLAIYGHVGRILAAQKPCLGGIDGQAKAVFAAQSTGWAHLAAPAARDLLDLAEGGPTQDLAESYVRDLGATINVDAAAGLASAMEVQLAKGQHPDVAWQRATAGYGLDAPAMRGYISAAMTSTVPVTPQKALLAYAEKIADREVIAWSTLPAPITKAYDPQEQRDETGRWATRGPRAKVKLKVADEVDALMARPIAEPANKFATLNPYAALAPDRFTALGRNKFAALDANKFAAPAENKFAALGPDKFAKPARRGRVVSRNMWIFNAPIPGDTPAPPEDPKVRSYALYLPMQDIGKYAKGKQGDREENFNKYSVVDFTGIGNWYEDNTADPVPVIELRNASSEWNFVDGVEGIDDSDWSAIVAKAVPIWHDVQENPVEAAAQLAPEELTQLAQRAGYPAIWSSVLIEQRIKDNVWMQDHRVTEMDHPGDVTTFYEPGLTDALADWVVWHQPGIMPSGGKELADLLEDTKAGDKIDRTDFPELMTFDRGIHQADSIVDVRGRYDVKRVQYHSAIGEFGHSVRNGRIGLKEIYLRPTP